MREICRQPDSKFMCGGKNMTDVISWGRGLGLYRFFILTFDNIENYRKLMLSPLKRSDVIQLDIE